MDNPAGVSIIVGGETVIVPPLNFAGLKLVWPDIQAMASAPDAVAQGDLAIKIFAAGLKRLRPKVTAETLAWDVVGGEFYGLVEALPEYLRVSGLVTSGEAPAGS